MTAQKFFVFSLSAKDYEFEPHDMEKAIKWLTDKRDEPNPRCLFRYHSPRDVPSGSIMLFSFDAQIFGQAIFKGTKIKFSPAEQEEQRKNNQTVYRHFVYLEPKKSIQTFLSYPTKKEITEKLGINFSRIFTYFSYDEYQKILNMAKKN